MGALGSIVFVGQAFGCISSSIALQKFPEHRVVPIGLMLNLGAILWFTQVHAYESLMISRGLTGLFQQIINIYFPVWTDAYVAEEKKSSWLSIIMVGSTIGNIVGYIIGASVQESIGW